jgi:hypothetical protein
MQSDLTIIYYTSNYLEETNPYFLSNTMKQLGKAASQYPIVIVSQKPVDIEEWKALGFSDVTNVVMGDIGRSHLNIYRQILEGCKAAKTKFVAMAEDDILYSPEHFDFRGYIGDAKEDVFYYDMNKVSLFTWTIPVFSFRFKREVVNQLICGRQYLIDAMEERFKRVEELKALGWEEEKIIKYWGDPGRYEDILGVTIRKTRQESCKNPSIVFSHEYAYGYEFNQGKKKRLGDLRIVELYDWGKATDVLKLYRGDINEKIN